MEYLLVFVFGLVLGAIIVLVINWLHLNRMRDSFGALSLEVLSKNSSQFLELAKANLATQTEKGESQLEGKKQLIDQTLEAMKAELEKVQQLVVDSDKDRAEKYGQLDNQL